MQFWPPHTRRQRDDLFMKVGVDLGGTKIEIIALDESEVLHRERRPTPHGDYPATLSAVAELVRRAEATVGAIERVGIGHPGAISPVTGLIKNSNSTLLNGKALDRDLESALGREVRLANDADCFALSEAIDGAGAGAETVFGVILGTGVGGGIVVRRELVVGPNAITGEWGHNPLPAPTAEEWEGEECYCGRTGCIETFLSGRGMTLEYTKRLGEEHSVPEIANRAAAGDPEAQAALDLYADRLARALASVINILDPHVIVLGGGLSNLDYLYGTVPQLWGGHVLSDTVETKLARNVHGDSSGVRGAAWLW